MSHTEIAIKKTLETSFLFKRSECHPVVTKNLFLWQMGNISPIWPKIYATLYLMIGCNPASNYMFKVNNRILEQGVKYVQS